MPSRSNPAFRMAEVHHSPRRLPRRALLALSALAALVLGACSEDLEGGAACPALCPGTEVPLRDTVLDPTVDPSLLTARTVPLVRAIGAEPVLLLADRDDTLQTRVVVRFDTIIPRYRKLGQATSDTTTFPVESVDSARIVVRVDTALSVVPSTLTIRAYDVDGAGDDTSVAVIESRLTADRLVGSLTFSGDTLRKVDSLVIPIDPAVIPGKLAQADTTARRLRVALVAEASQIVQLRLYTTASGAGAILRYTPAGADTTLPTLSVGARSRTPTGDAEAMSRLADFVTMPVAPPALVDPSLIAVGGMPARRGYLRFELPRGIVDSTTIVLAELRLVQRPSPIPDLLDSVPTSATNAAMLERRDTVEVIPLIGVGGANVTDPTRAAQLARRIVGSTTYDSLSIGSRRLLPSGSGEVLFDLGGLLRRWRVQSATDPRYIVLSAAREGVQVGTVYFYAPTAADPALRPRLHIRYIPKVGYGIP